MGRRRGSAEARGSQAQLTVTTWLCADATVEVTVIDWPDFSVAKSPLVIVTEWSWRLVP